MRSQLLIVAAVLFSSSQSEARTYAFVHGMNATLPSTSAACSYWGGCSCSAGYNFGANALHGFSPRFSNSGYCGYAGGVNGKNGPNARALIRYDASRSWFQDAAAADPICSVAAQIRAIPDTSVVGVCSSAGGLVCTSILTDAANGWGTCRDDIQAAAQKLVYVATIGTPFSGTKLADAVNGHLANTGNPLTDWLHNFCGNTVGAISTLFLDDANAMTWSLQTGVAPNYASRFRDTMGKPVVNSWGTSAAGGDFVWLRAARDCTGLETNNDGFVAKYSARACTNAGSGSTCSGRPSGFTDGVWASLGHSSGRNGTSATSTNSSGHAHGMADLVKWHTGM